MQKTTSTLLLFLCLTLKGFGQEANLDYTLKAIPVPELGSAAINTKGQVAGIAFIDGHPVLHMWLPRPDYDLEAGVHSWPVPEELGGATFGILTKVSGFADNGTVLIENFFGSFRTSGYMYFQHGSFFPMFGWSTSNPYAYVPINISNSGIIYTTTDLIPNAALVNNHFGIRTEGPGVVSQTYAGEVLQTQSPNGPGNYIQAQGLRRGNSNGVHVAGDWIRDWSSEVFERFIPGTWDGRFVDRTPPGTTTRFAAIDINDKNQVLLVENGPPVPRAFVFLPERDYNLETAGYHEIIFADDVTPPGRLTRISGSGDIYRAGVGPLFYSLTKNDLLSADSLAMGSGIAVDAILQINDLGQLLIRGEDGTDGSNTFIISPNIVATVKVEPEQVEVGETFYLDVNITNTSDRPYTLTGVLGSSFKVFGTALAGLEQIVNPPGGPLEPGKSFQQKFSWKSSKSGKISFALQAVGFYSDQTQTLTPELRSNEVLIAPQGDLLVNYGDASDINWLGEELYQEIPIEPQRLESTIESTGGFEFKLRVKNNAEETKSFRLKAEELGLDDWDITYLYKAVGGTLPDITADILGPNGIGYTIPAEGEMDFAIQVSATDSTVSTQKSIILALTDPEVPDQTSDAVELVVNRSDITIDVSPKFPLVGHKATVTVKYQNNTEETVTDIKPTFIEAETATYRGGAEVELLTPEPTPPSVASLAPGETTEFVYEYRLKAEGKVDFEATINGRKGNGTFFYSPLGESRRVDIGKISVDEFELVQALPGVPLIGQKQTGMRITLKNTSPEPHDLTFLRILEADGKEISDPREVSDLPPGTRTFFSSVVGKDEESVYPELSSTPGKAEIILFEGDEEVQDYTGRSKQFSYEPKHTFPLDLTYATVRIKASDGLDIGVPPDIAAAIKSTHGNFINEVLPMPHTEFGSFHLPRTLLASDISEDA
ncbi:MAG: hypothetical protein KJT03_02635, partial [Verrucomicrobiae bacterium]|nr:hypothetical protein [Verrucomicrobiae bacterium]